MRAARHRMPLLLAIIGGDPRRFVPYAGLYRRALTQLDLPELPIGVHSPGHVAETDEQAQKEFFPPYKAMRDRIGRERGWPPMRAEEFRQEIEYGSLYVGSPETVAAKIARTAQALGIARFDLKYSAGPLPHDAMMRSVELYGTRVIPRVRELLAEHEPIAL